jgi:hypothetical protein
MSPRRARPRLAAEMIAAWESQCRKPPPPHPARRANLPRRERDRINTSAVSHVGIEREDVRLYNWRSSWKVVYEAVAFAAAFASKFGRRSFAPIIATAPDAASTPPRQCVRRRASGANSSRLFRVRSDSCLWRRRGQGLLHRLRLQPVWRPLAARSADLHSHGRIRRRPRYRTSIPHLCRLACTMGS